tara:strand:- start:354 stop:665 length:312 start_codon:yes stop_codon:yes gene_type:complete
MPIPQITSETALAVVDKMTKDSPTGAAAWTFENAEKWAEEQPALFHTIAANIAQCFTDKDEYDAELAAGKSMYIALVTYKLVKSAVEAEELRNLFVEENEDES